jgi:predicted secreted protein
VLSVSPKVKTVLKALTHRVAHLLKPDRPVDDRGRRLVAIIECMLNQNARDAGAATFPSMNWELVALCREYDVGILQMPCPEMACLGQGRVREPGQSIRDALDTVTGRHCCSRIAAEVADRLEAYHRAGFRVIAILGGNPQSPGCAVHDKGDDLLPESGILMQELQAEIRKRDLEVPFRGLRDSDAELLVEDLRWLRGVFAEAV